MFERRSWAVILVGLSLVVGLGCNRGPQVTMPKGTYPLPPDPVSVGSGGGPKKAKAEPAKEEKPEAEKK